MNQQASGASPLLILEDPQQRLVLAPALGGSIAAWEWKPPGREPIPLLRTWDGQSEDRYTMACFPLVPWSNRITQGGFAHQGRHYPIRENRSGEPYPIHGDGWLQAWLVRESGPNEAVLTLRSSHFDGNPYDYESTQHFEITPQGLHLTLTVTHLGKEPLPYGLGLHPYFVCNESTRLQFHASGIWLSGPDPIPIIHSASFPPGWDYNLPAPLEGSLIDNCYTGWDGSALIEYPDQHLALQMHLADSQGYCLLYRPPQSGFFCFEPITHPIDAFHAKGRPGLVVLREGKSARITVRWEVESSRGLAAD